MIGEAVGDLPDDVRALGPAIPWSQIKGLRDFLAHQNFAIDMAIIDEVLVDRIPELMQVAEDFATKLPGGSFHRNHAAGGSPDAG